MANNTVLPGTGERYASDEVENAAGEDVNFQIIKLGHSMEGVEPEQASGHHPLPTHDWRMMKVMEELLVQIKFLNAQLKEGFETSTEIGDVEK
jgi:hypothetical protein